MSAPSPGDMLAMMPFAATIGVRLQEASPEQVVGVLDWSPERCTAGGILHGGALFTLADSTAAVCAVLNLPSGATTATTESSVRFLRAARSGSVTATARPLHVGRRQIVVETRAEDDAGRLVLLVTQGQAVLDASASRGDG
jgi:1,4-dihydroxy-2-naphthoyl-CoA hydrolase